MEFTTKIDISKSPYPLSYREDILLLGSCFAENIGRQLKEMKFHVDINPFGILYNPASIAQALRHLMDGTPFCREDLFLSHGLYRSFHHHGNFSDMDADNALEMMNQRFLKASRMLPHANRLVLTFGTSFVYSLKENGYIVANCHKLPEALFDRRRMSTLEIVDQWKELLASLWSLNPDLKIIMTVSPIRHWKDGAHGNQLSKSTLMMAVEQLQELFPERLEYFPSYELMMDELRDYRFYADDMLHPSQLAIAYMTNRFREAFFSEETKQIEETWKKLKRAVDHRPFQPQSPAYKQFLLQTLLKMKHLKEKFPFFDISNEIEILTNKI